MSAPAVTIEETTTDALRAQGFRNFLLTTADEFGRNIIGITVHHTANLGMFDEQSDYRPVPYDVMTNPDLARTLLPLAQQLLDHPHFSSLPQSTPTATMQCAEG